MPPLSQQNAPQPLWLLSGIVSALIAVIVAAVGAHGPLAPNTPALQHLLATASLFHLTHSLALIQYSQWRSQNPRPTAAWPAVFFILGMLGFVGSLYVMVFSNFKIPGVITPIGGAFLILAWLTWGVQSLRTAPKSA
jgi:uncharacterized membrane protein YgdD (TMEM256/DUF423 family)